jgi:hypothetical protein
MTAQLLFGIAGGISTLWFFFHLIQGGKEVVRPFRATPGLDPVVRDTQHLCWHYVTVTVALMAALFAVAATTSRSDLAMAGTALAWGFTLVGIGQVPAMGARYRDLPQGWLFLPIAALGTAGLML